MVRFEAKIGPIQRFLIDPSNVNPLLLTHAEKKKGKGSCAMMDTFHEQKCCSNGYPYWCTGLSIVGYTLLIFTYNLLSFLYYHCYFPVLGFLSFMVKTCQIPWFFNGQDSFSSRSRLRCCKAWWEAHGFIEAMENQHLIGTRPGYD